MKELTQRDRSDHKISTSFKYKIRYVMTKNIYMYMYVCVCGEGRYDGVFSILKYCVHVCV